MQSDVITTNLLLVDDQPQNLTALEAILEPLGQNLVRASSGKEALKYLLTGDFAAILLDVQMPEMDGFETAALIKERQRSRHIPIVFLTALSKEKSYVSRGYSVGAVDYISKPFDPDMLRSKVHVFVELAQKNERAKRQSLLLHEQREREVADFKRASEQRYQTLAESMPQIVWTASADGKLTYGNRRWFECAGLRRTKTNALDWKDVLHPDDLGPFRDAWEAATSGNRDWEGEYRFGSAGGGYRWHLVRAIAAKNERKQVISWIGTSTDINDRKHAEEGLRLLAEASRQLSSSADLETALRATARVAVPHLGDWCIIDILDEKQKLSRIAVEHRNAEHAERVRTFAREGLVDAAFGPTHVVTSGKSEMVVNFPSDLRVPVDEVRSKAIKELALRSFMCMPLIARGRVLGAMTLMTAEAGFTYVEGHLELAEDLARRCAAAVDAAQLYAVAQRERTKLEDVNRTKDEFLATVSHELRTPLNAMLGWTQILRAGHLDETRFQRALETIERNAKTQAQLIADLLDVSRIVTGKLHIDFTQLPLAHIVEGAVEAARPAAEAAKVALIVHIDTTVGDVRGDPLRLQQVVNNLLSNAIKFTPAGGRVEIELLREGARGILRVIDSGRGIEPDFLPHVFERFRQADSTSTRSRGGLGLGLAIVHHLVGLHDGVVSATSPGKNKGATFTVTLPLLGEAHAHVENGTRARDEGLPVTLATLANLHVLVVEDDADGRDLLRALLEERGARVSTADAVSPALELLRSGSPDIVVSDIGLPGEDGYTFIARVRALTPEQGGLVPAIALTAYASVEDRQRAISAGFQAHITKPLEPAKLSATVARLAGRATN